MTHLLEGTFGKYAVSPGDRERRIRHVFESVAQRYDLMNDVMSLGIHRLWKRALARAAAIRPGQRIVDLAGGTGDVARLLAEAGFGAVSWRNFSCGIACLHAGTKPKDQP